MTDFILPLLYSHQCVRRRINIIFVFIFFLPFKKKNTFLGNKIYERPRTKKKNQRDTTKPSRYAGKMSVITTGGLTAAFVLDHYHDYTILSQILYIGFFFFFVVRISCVCVWGTQISCGKPYIISHNYHQN